MKEERVAGPDVLAAISRAIFDGWSTEDKNLIFTWLGKGAPAPKDELQVEDDELVAAVDEPGAMSRMAVRLYNLFGQGGPNGVFVPEVWLELAEKVAEAVRPEEAAVGS